MVRKRRRKKFLSNTVKALESISADQNKLIDQLSNMDPEERYKKLFAVRKIKSEDWFVVLESSCNARIKAGQFNLSGLLLEIKEIQEKYKPEN